jgi:hypothetical protein
MKVPIQEIIYWILFPLLNFLFWYYFGHMKILNTSCDSLRTSSNAVRKPQDNSLEKLLQDSIEQLKEDCERQRKYELEERSFAAKQCQAPSTKDYDHKLSLIMEDTKEFERIRTKKLASMTVDILIRTYVDADTAILILDSEGKATSIDSCTTIDHHTIPHYLTSCFAITYVKELKMTENLVRIDQDIDIYGLSISNPDPSQVDKYSEPILLNKWNKGHFYPSGFFRKVPKERGRERTKDKLGSFLAYFDEINDIFLKKIQSHNLKKGDDLVAMVVNEGELDLFLNFACSCRFHSISLNNIFVFAGNQ